MGSHIRVRLTDCIWSHPAAREDDTPDELELWFEVGAGETGDGLDLVNLIEAWSDGYELKRGTRLLRATIAETTSH